MLQSACAIAFYDHHIEHLAPLCELFQMPLLVFSERAAAIARRAYPPIQIIVKTLPEPFRMVDQLVRSPSGLHGLAAALQDYDILFYSHLFARAILRRLLSRSGKRAPRVVFCPHGFSEKQQTWSAGAALQDIVLVYGQSTLDQLKCFGAYQYLARYVVTGNYRKAFYDTHKNFYAAWIESSPLSRIPLAVTRPTILYAPTWADHVGSSSLHNAIAPLIRNLPETYYLIIKPHPHVDDVTLERVQDVIGLRQNVFMLHDPVTFPLLQLADIYVGDMSSLAYDFLVLAKPMVFLNQAAGSATDPAESLLFRCGPVLAPPDYEQIGKIVDEELAGRGSEYSDRRLALYDYVHASDQTLSVVRDQIVVALSGKVPIWMR